MLLAVRADASETIGSGHVRRTLALARVLRDRGVDVHFVSRRGTGDLHGEIASEGFVLHAFEAGAQAEAALQSLAPIDALLADGYSIDASAESAARAWARRILAVDDLGRRHDCDLLLDQNLGATVSRYAGKVPDGARLLLGPRYALLREEFRKYVAAPRSRDGRVGRILVSMGGFDSTNETGKVLDAIQRVAHMDAHVDVVLPERAPHAPSVAERCAQAGHTYHGDTAQMAALMERADLAVGAMGSTAWERCLLGLPAVVVTVAENQREGARACADAGAALWLGDASGVAANAFANALASLFSQPERVREMSVRARSAAGVEDGIFSTDRAAAAMMEVAGG